MIFRLRGFFLSFFGENGTNWRHFTSLDRRVKITISEAKRGEYLYARTSKMARKKKPPPPPHSRKFSFPIYASVFYDSVFFLVAGGGGKKSSGIRNLVTVSSFHDGCVSEPITAAATDDDAPQRLALHPDGVFVVCVFGGSIGVFRMERNLSSNSTNGLNHHNPLSRNDSTEDLRNRPEVNMIRSNEFPRRVALTADDRDVKCAVFSPSGRQLAIGLETGEVKIVQWPSLEVDMELGAHESGAAVTDIAWSPDERVIVSCAAERIGSSNNSSNSNGQQQQQQQQNQQQQQGEQQQKTTKGAIMWSIERGERITALPDPTSARFNCKGFPSSSRKPNCLKVFRGASFSNTGEFFFCGINVDGVGYLVKFETTNWTPMAAIRAFRDAPISAYAANKNGSRHACGSAEGDVVAFDGGGLRKQSSNSRKRSLKRIAAARNAHMIFVTTISWNARGDVVLSGSADASVYCLHVKNNFKSGLYGSLMKLFLWMTVLIACLLGWVFLLMKVFDESTVPLLNNNNNNNNNNNAERGLSSLDERQRVISKRSAGIPLDDREREVFEEMESENAASEEEQRAAEGDYYGGNDDPHASASRAYHDSVEYEKQKELEYAEARAMEEKQKREWELQNEANLRKMQFAEEEKKRQKEAAERETVADDKQEKEEKGEEEKEKKKKKKKKKSEKRRNPNPNPNRNKRRRRRKRRRRTRHRGSDGTNTAGNGGSERATRKTAMTTSRPEKSTTRMIRTARCPS